MLTTIDGALAYIKTIITSFNSKRIALARWALPVAAKDCTYTHMQTRILCAVQYIHDWHGFHVDELDLWFIDKQQTKFSSIKIRTNYKYLLLTANLENRNYGLIVPFFV